MSVRSPDSLDATRLWDEGCVKSRLDELTKHFVSEFALEDMRRLTEEQKRAFKPVSQYPYNEPQIRDMFSEKASGKAIEILEAERQGYVDFHSERFKQQIVQVIKRIRYLIFVVDEKGKVSKLKEYAERVPNLNARYREDPAWREVHYVGEHDIERLNQINHVKTRLSRLDRYAPYFKGELKPLWEAANEIATLEVVRVEDEKGEKKRQKKSSVESVGDQAKEES